MRGFESRPRLFKAPVFTGAFHARWVRSWSPKAKCHLVASALPTYTRGIAVNVLADGEQEAFICNAVLSGRVLTTQAQPPNVGINADIAFFIVEFAIMPVCLHRRPGISVTEIGSRS